MKLIRTREKQRKNLRERGQILVEFSIVAVVFFLFLFGIFDFARMFQSWITVQHSAREAARYAITGRTDCDGVTSDRSACIIQTAEDGTLGLPDGGIGSTLVSVSYQYWDFQSSGTYSDTSASGVGGPCDVIEVEVVYQHSFLTPLVKPVMGLLGADPIALKGTQRMTNEPWGSCTATGPPDAPPSGYGGSGGVGGSGSSPPDTPTPIPTATTPPTATPPPTATSPPTATAVPTATSPPPQPTATPTKGKCKWWEWWC